MTDTTLVDAVSCGQFNMPAATSNGMGWKERFWDKVDIQAPDECWEWQSYVNPQGYGAFRKKGGGTHHNAHRFAFEVEHGYQPEENVVMHKCDNRVCVNPNHLEEGTQSENVKKAFEEGNATQVGEENSCSVLNESDVREIKNRIQNGDVQSRIAEDYDLHPSTITKIKKGSRWGHVSIQEDQ